MQIRTYLRTIFYKLFRENFIIKVFKNVVNFYYNLYSKTPTCLKFDEKNPILNIDAKKNINFQSVTGDKIDCK